MKRLLIFDLDGVITSEADYWSTVEKALHLDIPAEFIYWCKNHAINHNWDMAFVALTAAPDFEGFTSDRALLTGRELLESCPGYRAEPWRKCHEICQTVLEAGPLPTTVLHTESQFQKLFQELELGQFVFSIATGRPRLEAVAPLENAHIWGYFDKRRVVTHDEVQQAEREAGFPLGKPHPFVAYRAMYPEMPLAELLALPSIERPDVWFIGDTISDIKAARAAGVTPIGILSAMPPGIYRDERERALREAGCDTILESVLSLPSCVL